jgi:hypothetical protein
MTLHVVGDVPLGVDQKAARQADNAFIRATAGSGRQFRGGGIRNVYADDGEVAVGEFPYVGAPGAAGSFRAVRVRVLADAP